MYSSTAIKRNEFCCVNWILEHISENHRWQDNLSRISTSDMGEQDVCVMVNSGRPFVSE